MTSPVNDVADRCHDTIRACGTVRASDALHAVRMERMKALVLENDS